MTTTAASTSPPTTPQSVIELDARRRTTIRLGHHDRYRVTEYPDGSLLLEPVFVLTQDELILRANPELEARIERTMHDPSQWVKRPLPAVKD